jgi:simple sugar transport system permease protein
MLASNKDASKYAGSDAKIMLIVIMTISGALSGLAGFLYYTELGVISAKSEPNTMGFDTIAIALLVYNNSFGIGISSILFTIIKLGCSSLKPEFPPLTEDFAQIMFGIIIYIAAIGIVFEKFKIYTYLKHQYIY